MSMDTVEITPDMMCVMRKDTAGKAERGVFPVLNMQEEAERIADMADDYQRRGVSGPMCRRCGRLPAVTE